ncbi:type I glyceraldehyde-3-phosphate dehydrogenase, partial [Candidatus Peregrinibacteria bacterium]|nr:type I glyceraldehyde-3-phosphate dehydrogenase [Candidatus Peregrinibacteria bacterium]
MKPKIAINGFGRIGRACFRILMDDFADDFELVAVNDPADKEALCHLLKYDSNFGTWSKTPSCSANGVEVECKMVEFSSDRDP